ncbi:membrane hypothetical protein [Pseudomonas sp. IT-P2]
MRNRCCANEQSSPCSPSPAPWCCGRRWCCRWPPRRCRFPTGRSDCSDSPARRVHSPPPEPDTWRIEGWGQWVSGLSLLLMLGSWLPIALTQSSLWALLLGVITLDLGLQAVHVTSQSMIYNVRPEAQSRLTAGYMLFYSIGSALGSIASTAMYAWAGWPGVCWLGAAINMVALLYWWRTLATRKRDEAACALATSD